jgi:hypothetical protein
LPSIDLRTEFRLSLPTLLLLLAVVGGGSFAAGGALNAPPMPPSAPTAAGVEPRPLEETPLEEIPQQELDQTPLPPGHPPIDDQASQDMPLGHPPIDDEAARAPGAAGAHGGGPAAEEDSLEWKVPARWQSVPNPNTMRLATYRVPRVAGDTADAELSIAHAGGSADANAERWIRQFDPEGQKAARRTTRTVGSAEVAIVEVGGTYSGGMSKEASAQPGWMLIGAIVSTTAIPCFFKLTGPEKSVRAARSEFDALIGSLAPSRNRGL